MKRLFTICGSLLLCAYANAYDFEVDGIYYNILSEEDKTCEVTHKSSNATDYSGDIIIPSIANGYKVVKIGSYSFSNYGIFKFNGTSKTINSIYIPETIESFGERAIAFCNNIKQITVDSKNKVYDSRNNCNCIIETESNKIIAGCDNSIIVDGIETIGYCAFSYCLFSNITIPNSVNTIEERAFAGCDSLKLIEIPNSVKYIGEASFIGCDSLKSIEIPSSVTYLGESALNGCENIESIILKGGITNILGYTFAGCTNLKSIVIPSTVTSIISSCFNNCSSLESITIYATCPPTIDSTPINSTSFNVYVMPGYGNLYSSSSIWESYTIIEDYTIFNDEYGTDSFIIVDGENFSLGISYRVPKLQYTRTFSNTKWQALYVPFAIPYDDVKDKLDIAWLNNVHMYDDDGDNNPDRTTLEFYLMNSGSTEPNTPYLVKAKSAGDFTLELEDVNISPATCNPFECSTFTQTFTIYGTYSGVTGSDMVSNKYYAPANGSLCYTTNTSASLKPQRWYLKIANKNGSAVTNLASSIRLMIDEEMEEETSISELTIGNPSESYVCIDGRNVSTPTAPGLYVHNNKKVFVR